MLLKIKLHSLVQEQGINLVIDVTDWFIFSNSDYRLHISVINCH